MREFLRVTGFLTVALVALIVGFFLLKIVFVAAVLAAIALGGVFLFHFVRAFVRIRRNRGVTAS